MAAAWLDRVLGEPRRPVGLTPARARWEWATTVALVGAMLAYANADAWRYSRREGAAASSAGLPHLKVLGAALAWAALERLSPADLGLGHRHLGRGLLWGAVVGLLGAIPIRLFFAFPLVSRRAVAQPEFEGLSRGRLLWLIGVQFLFGSAIVEEIAFRGLLHAKLVRLLGAGRALLVGNGVFAGWHLVITWYNLRRSNLPRALFPLLYLGALAALFGGGLLFGLVRQGSGHLAGSVLSHWLMVASIVLAVARPRRAARP
jgi:membrane protease YdiL (CAAX protease family)